MNSDNKISVRYLTEELAHLKASLELPKGTEYFMSDLHGEYHHFSTVIRSGAGTIKEKIHYCFFNQLDEKAQTDLESLIINPETFLESVSKEEKATEDWIDLTIDRLVSLTKFLSGKYSKEKIISLASEHTDIIDELLFSTSGDPKKISKRITREKLADELIITLSQMIQKLTIDHLHIIGDIYDRGPAPDKIIDFLQNYHSVDIQWGNHDITWMGAARGSNICLMNIIRICARYGHLNILEKAYDINLNPLYHFAFVYYKDNPAFVPKTEDDATVSPHQKSLMNRVQQAAAMIQFKLEHQLIKRRPEFKMNHRLLFNNIDFDQLLMEKNGKVYSLENTCFQTICSKHPDVLTTEELELVAMLRLSFDQSEKLQEHVQFLLDKGSMYLCYNDNLLLHGCLPLNPDGSFQSITLQGEKLSGKSLIDFYEKQVRLCCAHPKKETDFSTDMLWYLWVGEFSSLFGKKEMTTFERYFIADKGTHYEEKNAYYQLRNNQSVCENILKEFNLPKDDAHIINGHTPIKEVKGENPIKGNGKLIVIDGGFSKAYQKTTGISGYTLISNSFGMQLVTHQKGVVHSNKPQALIRRLVDRASRRKLIKDTTEAEKLNHQIKKIKQQIVTLEQ
ncbi:fructose-bisphosphatase class III [Vagococcus elongatus]|uniref:Fructose-1,6-bisphosphatase class 3 n=1 Tax=Vagococcus elongatus TaxID=180344 RepID=A0A430AY70_9ENTE|nr:fructose-bisphosphatase class III [Vagococcus elongatus]RSU13020.1 hypothetical protein CBF29_04950 [Vagococcus elongatus]